MATRSPDVAVPPPPRWLALLAIALVALSVLSAAAVAAGIPPAADLSLFRAGNIISDAVFTDAGTMTADQIQAFLQSQGGTCQTGYTCLKDFRISSVDGPDDRYCNGYSGVPNERLLDPRPRGAVLRDQPSGACRHAAEGAGPGHPHLAQRVARR